MSIRPIKEILSDVRCDPVGDAETGDAHDEIRDVIIEVLCGQALADHLGDVRDAETKLWELIGAPKLPSDDPAWDSDSAWRLTRARLRSAGLSLPSYFGDDDDD